MINEGEREYNIINGKGVWKIPRMKIMARYFKGTLILCLRIIL